MGNEYKEFINQLLSDMQENDQLHSEDIPNIDLYMDQVLTYMDKNIGVYKRNVEDKILTKTMINNYSKSNILPPSNKKKYSKNHIILLAMIYSLKQTLSITDIKKLMVPLQEKISSGMDISHFFDTITDAKINSYQSLSEEINATLDKSLDLFADLEEDDSINVITTAYLLSVQASIQKHISNALIDKYLTSVEGNENRGDKKADKKTKK